MGANVARIGGNVDGMGLAATSRGVDRTWHTDPMHERRGANKPRDLNQLAATIVEEATGEEPPVPELDGKDPHAVALGRKGGKKGGPARAKALTPERRREIAQKAVAARWAKARGEDAAEAEQH